MVSENQQEKADSKGSWWYVMTYLKPAQIEWLLQRENLGEFVREGDPKPEPLEYFIPFQFLLRIPTAPVPTSSADDYADRKVADMEAEVDNGVREALHNYVFIHADEQRIAQLLESEWNRSGSLHLYHYRTPSGELLRVPDGEMRSFIETLRNRQLRYYIGQPIDAMNVGDTVTLHIAPWEGRKASVTRIEVRGGHTRLTVTLDILGNLTRVTFPDIYEGDISFDDEAMGRLVNGNLLLNFEEEMVSILAHRFGHKPTDEERRRTHARLARLYAYHNVKIDDADDYLRFTSLMLISASLLGEKEAAKQYVSQLNEHLEGKTEASTGTEAYMMLALFVALRDPALREAVKAYRNSHEDCPEVIRRMFSKVKRIRCR